MFLAVQWLVFLIIVLTACVFLFLSFEASRSRVLRRHSYSPSQKEDTDTPLGLNSSQSEEDVTTTSIIRHPPSTPDGIRRRPIRSHPIYRHANLDEAIHKEDLLEIRARLQNGEDANQHWPYLIYRLATSPSAASARSAAVFVTQQETSHRLEIARLCLDFGADVNALKGFNGQSALMIAIHFGNVDVAKLLIVNGATVCYSPPDSGLTALHRCVRLAVTGSATDALEMMKMLFMYGADANQTDRVGETPLYKLLFDAWFARDDEDTIDRLYPIALCLLENGARVPSMMKEKYILGNPLWDVVHTTIWGTEWPEQVGPNYRMEKGRFWATKEAEEAGKKLGNRKGNTHG